MQFLMKDNFSVMFMQMHSLIVQMMFSISEDDSFSEYSSDSDNMNLDQPKTLVINSDQKVKMKLMVLEKTFTGVSVLTIECNNLQSIRELIELILGCPK